MEKGNRMEKSMLGNSRTANLMVKASLAFAVGRSILGNSRTDNRMVRAPSLIPMDQSMSGNTRMANSGTEYDILPLERFGELFLVASHAKAVNQLQNNIPVGILWIILLSLTRRVPLLACSKNTQN